MWAGGWVGWGVDFTYTIVKSQFYMSFHYVLLMIFICRGDTDKSIWKWFFFLITVRFYCNEKNTNSFGEFSFEVSFRAPQPSLWVLSWSHAWSSSLAVKALRWSVVSDKCHEREQLEKRGSFVSHHHHHHHQHHHHCLIFILLVLGWFNAF